MFFFLAIEEESIEKINFLLKIDGLNFSKVTSEGENCLTLSLKNSEILKILLNFMIDSKKFETSQWQKWIKIKVKSENIFNICSSN